MDTDRQGGCPCAVCGVIGGIGIVIALVVAVLLILEPSGAETLSPRIYYVIGMYGAMFVVSFLLVILLNRVWGTFAYFVETWPARLLGYYVPDRKPKGKRKRKRDGP